LDWLNDNSEIYEFVEKISSGEIWTLNRILLSLAGLFIIWIVRWGLNKLIFDKIEDITARYWWSKFINYASFFLGFLMIVSIWFRGIQPLLTFIGIFSAGVAIALRSMLSNLAGWLFIIWRRPFRMGDRIEIDGVAGDVIDIRFFQFSIMEIGNWVEADQSTGRVIHVPNGRIFEVELANFSAGFRFIWNEVSVLIPFEANWKKGKKILSEIADERAGHLSEKARERVRHASRKFMIYYNKLTPIVYTSVEDSGIILTVRYLCEPQKRRSSEEKIWEDILNEFQKEEDLSFGYPTQRIYSKNLDELIKKKFVETDKEREE